MARYRAFHDRVSARKRRATDDAVRFREALPEAKDDASNSTYVIDHRSRDRAVQSRVEGGMRKTLLHITSTSYSNLQQGRIIVDHTPP